MIFDPTECEQLDEDRARSIYAHFGFFLEKEPGATKNRCIPIFAGNVFRVSSLIWHGFSGAVTRYVEYRMAEWDDCAARAV